MKFTYVQRTVIYEEKTIFLIVISYELLRLQALDSSRNVHMQEILLMFSDSTFTPVQGHLINIPCSQHHVLYPASLCPSFRFFVLARVKQS